MDSKQDITHVAVIKNRFVSLGLQIVTWLSGIGVLILSLGRTKYVNTMLTLINNAIAQYNAQNQTRYIIQPEEFSASTISSLTMYISGIFAAGLSLVIFQLLVKRIPQAFITIWERQILTFKPAEQPKGTTPIDETSKSNPDTPDEVSPEERYKTFLRRFERVLNHPVQWAIASLFIPLVFIWERTPVQFFNFWKTLIAEEFLMGLIYLLFGYLIQFCLAFMIGLFVWRILILGWYILRLSKTFIIHPKIGHPDSCGGLEPIGDLCLLIALVISIVGVFLGSWIIFAHIAQPEQADPLYNLWQQAMRFADLFSHFLWVPVTVAIVFFLAPLWNIHKAMQTKSISVQKKIEELATAITKIEETLVNQADTLDPKQSEELNKEFKTLQEIYQRNKKIPIWPFNVETLAKLTSSQLIPILVASGLSENIADVIQAILGAFL